MFTSKTFEYDVIYNDYNNLCFMGNENSVLGIQGIPSLGKNGAVDSGAMQSLTLLSSYLLVSS